MYELLVGQPPYSTKTNDVDSIIECMDATEDIEYPRYLHGHVCSLLKGLLQKDVN